MWFITKFRRRSESSVQQLRPIFQVTACVCASLRSVKMNRRKGQWDNWGLALSVRLFDAAPQSQTPAYYTDARRTSKVAWSPTLLPSSAASTFGMGPPRGNYLRRYSPRHGPDGAQYRKAPPFVRLFKSIGGAAKSDFEMLNKTRRKNDNEMMMMISAICSVAHQLLLLTCLLPRGNGKKQTCAEGGGQMCARTMGCCRCDQY